MGEIFTESIFELDDPNEFVYNRMKTDYIKIQPTSGTVVNFNKPGNITFEVNNQQYFLLMSDAFISCKFEIQKDDGGWKSLAVTDNITLENNFFPKLFSSIQLDVGSQMIETIHEPGVYDDMIRFVKTTYSSSKSNKHIQGWIPDENSGGAATITHNATKVKVKDVAGKEHDVVELASLDQVFETLKMNSSGINYGFIKRLHTYNNKSKYEVNWHLSPLLGYLDHRKVSYQLRYVLKLMRNSSTSSEVFYGDSTFNKKVRIVINSMELWIPQIQPSYEIQTMVNNRLASGRPINIIYLQRTGITPMAVTGNNFSFNIASGITKQPRYVLIAFKPNVNSNEHINDARFHLEGKTTYDAATKKFTGGDVKIEKVTLQLNNIYYPEDGITISYDENSFGHAFTEYENLCMLFGAIPQIDPITWYNLFPIFCFDCSSQNQSLKEGGINIKVNIKVNTASPNLNVYAMLFEDEHKQINIINGVMTNFI